MFNQSVQDFGWFCDFILRPKMLVFVLFFFCAFFFWRKTTSKLQLHTIVLHGNQRGLELNVPCDDVTQIYGQFFLKKQQAPANISCRVCLVLYSFVQEKQEGKRLLQNQLFKRLMTCIQNEKVSD